MIFKICLNYILGYIKVSVEGFYIERFINICTNNNILIWNLKREKNIKLYLNTSIKNFKNLVKIAKKTKCKIKVENKKGIPFLLNRYRKRKIFLILLLILCVFISVSSMYIWNIELVVKDGEEISGMEEDLKEAGLRIGMKKSSINTKDIINTIRLKRTDIAWLGIEEKGTNVIVKIVKSEEKPELIEQNEYCSIVAKKGGIITKINALNRYARS